MLGVIGFLLLAGVAAWEWTEIQDLRSQLAVRQEGGVDPTRLQALEDQLRTTRQDLQTLAAKPAPEPPPAPPPSPPVDLAPLEARLATLEKRPEATSSQSVDLAPIEARIAALEKRPEATAPKPVDLEPIEARITALEQRPLPPAFDDSAIKTRLDALAKDESATREQLDGLTKDVTARLDGLGEQVKAVQSTAVQSDQHATQAATRATRLGAATLALSSGKPLGPLPDAPPILQHFADEAPPTEAYLRLSFEAAAKAAEAASDPAAGTSNVVDRMWERIQTLVTVRRGDKVLVGAPADVVLADARQRLVAGDVAAAVATLDRLDPGAAAAMAPWREKAQSLLDARAALASLAASQPATP